MATEIEAVLEDVEIRGPYTNQFTDRKTGKKTESTFYTKALTANGIEYAQFISNDHATENPGDKVKITYQPTDGKQGKYNKVLDIQVLNSSKDSSISKNETVSSKTETTESKPIITSQTVTNKDLSIEVSGLLQALISTGKYHTASLGSSNLEDLESDLLNVLEVKRNVIAKLKE